MSREDWIHEGGGIGIARVTEICVSALPWRLMVYLLTESPTGLIIKEWWPRTEPAVMSDCERSMSNVPVFVCHNSVKMVLLWTAGDVFKTTYFLVNRSPPQFWVCGSVQIFIDVAILLQVFLYGRDTRVKLGWTGVALVFCQHLRIVEQIVEYPANVSERGRTKPKHCNHQVIA